ncbi:MAG: Na(+)-translocating NADH-quinone reductase subunit A [Planctomycetaceae bacterium]
MRRVSKGLDLPIEGDPEQKISDGQPVRSVAVVGPDYVGMKPTMKVGEGDRVRAGELLFSDKKTPGVQYTAPASGTIRSVNRGERRVFQSLVIDIDGEDQVEFAAHDDLLALDKQTVRNQLVESGLWTAIRERPYSKVANPADEPSSVFVQAIDTNPHAADPAVILGGQQRFFEYGLQVVSKLNDGPVYLCQPTGVVMPGGDIPGVTKEVFDGPHPAGLPGTHIHMLDPVSANKRVWYVNYQDVISIGYLFATGRLNFDRVISLAGPQVSNPRLIRTRLGASIEDITAGEFKDGENRVVSGSVLSGRRVTGPFGYLGRYHLQISAIAEGGEREFLGWQKPGFDKFSIKRVFASALSNRKFSFTTDTGGSKRAMVPIGMFEDVMPLDIIATFLLRALITGDTDQAQKLGCLELDEEDLALCTFVCPGKVEYGSLLRQRLTEIEKEG